MTPERAIEILDPQHREQYDSIETVNEACRLGIQALKIINPTVGKSPDYEPTNADTLMIILSDVIWAGADEDGFPEVDYNELVDLTRAIRCPYYYNTQPLCAEDIKNKDNPEAYKDCDACKAHWLMGKWEG